MKIHRILFLCTALASTLVLTTQCNSSSENESLVKAPADSSLNGTLMTFVNGIFSAGDYASDADIDGEGNDISGPSGKLPSTNATPFFSTEWKYTRFEGNTFTALREDYSVLGQGTYTNKVEGTTGESTILELVFTTDLEKTIDSVTYSYTNIRLSGALSRMAYRDVYSGICSYTETATTTTGGSVSYPRNYRFSNAIVTLTKLAQ
ncbi:hypothetical protein [Akkermansia glycaniphila]|uniref:Lipoprotein n=1 Tax=Akkermansia glycaniphila TaxID=1679444 RepID=A0A1C7PCV4_9BACT|nr:hypothetical protein [Akkermansia glycaniphila]MBT9450596.1 hypothetical protein [Akkermansia glycaniphila]OCA03377.1 hypothetical protein AC781_04665 [Akkermansia glycaniphila]SEH91402.1 Hypothetical protein PYTT_1672 [Akkermansia glycaniphila]